MRHRVQCGHAEETRQRAASAKQLRKEHHPDAVAQPGGQRHRREREAARGERLRDPLADLLEEGIDRLRQDSRQTLDLLGDVEAEAHVLFDLRHDGVHLARVADERPHLLDDLVHLGHRLIQLGLDGVGAQTLGEIADQRRQADHQRDDHDDQEPLQEGVPPISEAGECLIPEEQSVPQRAHPCGHGSPPHPGRSSRGDDQAGAHAEHQPEHEIYCERQQGGPERPAPRHLPGRPHCFVAADELPGVHHGADREVGQEAEPAQQQRREREGNRAERLAQPALPPSMREKRCARMP